MCGALRIIVTLLTRFERPSSRHLLVDRLSPIRRRHIRLVVREFPGIGNTARTTIAPIKATIRAHMARAPANRPPVSGECDVGSPHQPVGLWRLRHNTALPPFAIALAEHR